MRRFEYGYTIYENALGAEADTAGFRLEGEARISFPNGRLRMENLVDPAEGQKSNFVFWCPETLPADVSIEWAFWPVQEPGLCILFFAATGRNGEDLFDSSLTARTGEYKPVSPWGHQRVAYFVLQAAVAGGAGVSHLQSAQELRLSHGGAGRGPDSAG